MRIFRYREDVIPIGIFVAYFFLDLGMFFRLDNAWLVVGWMLLGILPKAFISAWNHHHQHVPTFSVAALNRLLEIVYGLQTGITGHAWVLHHNLGHHLNYLDQEVDESRWKDVDGRRMGVIRYSFLTACTAYPRCFQVGKRFPKHFNLFIGTGAATLGILGFLFYYNWFNALCIFFIPMCITLYNTAWHTFYHHAGLETKNEYEASFNIVDKWYNVFTGNLGYHTAHHCKMGLHWSRLPEYHEKISYLIPETLFRRPPPPFTWLSDKGGS